MNLYTVIHEYRGGTYVYQVEAIDENEALLKWGREIDPQLVQFMGKKLKEKLNKEIHEKLYELEMQPTPIEGIKNCWCAGIILSGLVNIIKTAKT